MCTHTHTFAQTALVCPAQSSVCDPPILCMCRQAKPLERLKTKYFGFHTRMVRVWDQMVWEFYTRKALPSHAFTSQLGIPITV